MLVIEYVTEEVSRQGHDVRTVDGLERVAWMLNAWVLAADWTWRDLRDEYNVERLGQLVERDRNKRGFRRCGVRVGNHICPPWQKVGELIRGACHNIVDATEPLALYREFLEIHPFADGNGRTGKILLNVLNGSMFDPVFPPNDFWGEPIRNP